MAKPQSSATALEGRSIEVATSSPKPDLSGLLSTFILATNLSESELHEYEDVLVARGAPLTYDIKAANLVIGNISKERRARFELKRGKVPFEDNEESSASVLPGSLDLVSSRTAVKRRKLRDETRELSEDVNIIDTGNNKNIGSDEAEIYANEGNHLLRSHSHSSSVNIVSILDSHHSCLIELRQGTLSSVNTGLSISRIKVVKLEWLRETVTTGMVQPFEPYTIYDARLLSQIITDQSVASNESRVLVETDNTIQETSKARGSLPHDIIERAKADIKPSKKGPLIRARNRDHAKEAASRDFAGRSFMPSTNKTVSKSSPRINKPPPLLRQTTSEEEADSARDSRPLPDWIREHKIYSCQRATPFETPNEAFIGQLKKIKLARLLLGDEVGVRAYSTSIASLAAFPYPLISSTDVFGLPGCDQKISQLFHEWHSSGAHIEAVAEIDADPVLNVLKLFYEIWGVGASTAREFYYDRHWRDLDDIIENGWKSLSRVQQIGVKYYDEFQLKMSRAQVEAIAAVIQFHARRLTDDRLEAIIVGGYRRGKLESGDADIILTHPSESMTLNLISSVVVALEDAGWITHTLTLALTNSNRNQQPLPLRSSNAAGHGFDTLDKALVVWQDLAWPSRESDLAADPQAKNPNPHRRVDIIVSPWRTIGCAVEGWTSGTTFQRDLRRYAKRMKGWKFDSSGVRDRESGRWIDLEGWSNPATRCTDWREAEKRVFQGFGLVYREPWERCTG